MTQLIPVLNTCGERSQRGFTLLEILIVLAIMGFVAGIVIPRISTGVSTSELKSAARQLAAGLRMARDGAVAHRADNILTLDVEKRSFRVGGDSREYRISSQIDLRLFTAQSDLVDEKIGAIRFFPDGGSNGGRITVAAGERKYEVDVDWLTGRVAITE